MQRDIRNLIVVQIAQHVLIMMDEYIKKYINDGYHEFCIKPKCEGPVLDNVAIGYSAANPNAIAIGGYFA